MMDQVEPVHVSVQLPVQQVSLERKGFELMRRLQLRTWDLYIVERLYLRGWLDDHVGEQYKMLDLRNWFLYGQHRKLSE